MNAKGYDAVDIARYVVNYSWDIGSPISNLKLQKVLYFIQGNFLRILSKPCFFNEIEAWQYGPVVPDVYREFKQYGSNSIRKIDHYYKLEQNKFEPVKKEIEFNIDDEDKKVIDDVIETCKNLGSSYLVELTHKQSPWIKTSKRYNKTIDIDIMKEYFCDE